jgi:hypothetical protein
VKSIWLCAGARILTTWHRSSKQASRALAVESGLCILFLWLHSTTTREITIVSISFLFQNFPFPISHFPQFSAPISCGFSPSTVVSTTATQHSQSAKTHVPKYVPRFSHLLDVSEFLCDRAASCFPLPRSIRKLSGLRSVPGFAMTG